MSVLAGRRTRANGELRAGTDGAQSTAAQSGA